jgi:L-threonylcarbamoyladenylate synthase
MLLSVKDAAKNILNGQVIAYPTEAVWGLGCDPMNEAAVHKILALKSRPVEKGLILVFSSVDQVAQWITLSDDQLGMLDTDSQRATTFIVPCDERIPTWIKGEHQSVAIRVSKHPAVAALCQLVGHGIVSTSANPAGLPEAQDAGQVKAYFGAELPTCEGHIGSDPRPSQIIDIMTGRLLRS